MIINLHKPVVAEETLIQNITTECGNWLNILC